MKVSTLLIIAILIATTGSAEATLDKKAAQATIREFNQSSRSVPPEFLTYPGYTLRLDDIDHVCHLPAALRRLAMAGETFTIRKIHLKHDHFRVEVATRGKRKFLIAVYDRGELSQAFLDAGLPRLLGDVFDFGPAPAPVTFIGHRESRLVHHDRCNHLPPKEDRELFTTRDDAAAAGFRDCPICFGTEASLPFPAYLAHRTAGLQAAKAFELVYPLSTDASLQARLERLGGIVLEGWPLDLAGFDYDFRVVHAAQPIAASFSTGIVVVSDLLLEAAEADEEILYVLAHEIAHCELHLPPRSAFADRQPYPLEAGYGAYVNWSVTQQLAADLVAVNWFACQDDHRWRLDRARSALAKVQQAVGAVEDQVWMAGEYYTLHERLWLFEPARFQTGDLRRVFAAADREGDVRHELRFLGLMAGEKGTVPFFLLTTTDYQDETRYSGSTREETGTFTLAGGDVYNFYPELWAAVPGFTTLLAGRPIRFLSLHEAAGQAIVKAKLLTLEGVKSWTCEGTEY